MAGYTNLVLRPFSFFCPFDLLPEKPWGRGCCAICFFCFSACYWNVEDRNRVEFVPPHPSVLVRPVHPDLWKSESNKVWLWGLLKTCSYSLRPMPNAFPTNLQERTAKTWLTALRPLRELRDVLSCAAKQHPSTPRTAFSVPWSFRATNVNWELQYPRYLSPSYGISKWRQNHRIYRRDCEKVG